MEHEKGSPAATAERGHAAAAAEHITAMARALGAMGGAACIASRQRVAAEEADAIEELLPVLARRYGLDAECERRGELLTVTLGRTGAARGAGAARS